MSFIFKNTASTEISALSLHDALPILGLQAGFEAFDANSHVHFPEGLVLHHAVERHCDAAGLLRDLLRRGDRKSTRLNSSHSQTSYAVFCLKKKPNQIIATTTIIIVSP